MLTLDDFRTAKQLKEATLLSTNQVSASLHELRKYKAVDCLAENGQLWWYATPDTDQRQHTVDMRQEELKSRKKRKLKKENGS